MKREPVVVLGEGPWKWVYEGAMVALAILLVVLLPFDNEGWVLVTNLTVWAVFVADYIASLALSTDRKEFLKRNIIDLLAIMPADFFRALRVLRVARLLRVVRAATVVGRVLREVRGVAMTNRLHWVPMDRRTDDRIAPRCGLVVRGHGDDGGVRRPVAREPASTGRRGRTDARGHRHDRDVDRLHRDLLHR
jgi:hypothetical protein